MDIQLYNYIAELEQLYKTSIDAKKQIANENCFGEKAVEYKRISQTAIHNANVIMDKQIDVDMRSIIESSAQLLNTTIDNITITHTTTADRPMNIDSADFIAKIRTNQTRSIHRRDYITYTIASKKQDVENYQELTFTTPINLDQIQADGKPMENQCFVHHTNNNETKLGIGNYYNLILRFPLKQIVKYNKTTERIEPHSKSCQAIILANELSQNPEKL